MKLDLNLQSARRHADCFHVFALVLTCNITYHPIRSCSWGPGTCSPFACCTPQTGVFPHPNCFSSVRWQLQAVCRCSQTESAGPKIICVLAGKGGFWRKGWTHTHTHTHTHTPSKKKQRMKFAFVRSQRTSRNIQKLWKAACFARNMDWRVRGKTFVDTKVGSFFCSNHLTSSISYQDQNHQKFRIIPHGQLGLQYFPVLISLFGQLNS